MASIPDRRGIRTSIRTTSGISSVGLLDRLLAVGGLAHQIQVRLAAEDHLEAAPEQRVVVDDHDAEPFDVALAFLRHRCSFAHPLTLGRGLSLGGV